MTDDDQPLAYFLLTPGGDHARATAFLPHEWERARWKADQVQGLLVACPVVYDARPDTT